MKVIVRDIPGYSQQSLENLLRRMSFPSSFFDQAVPVRGVCFAAGSGSAQLAREFVEGHLGLGTIGLRLEGITLRSWREFSSLFTRPKAEVSKVAFILHDLDRTSPEVQAKIADVIDATDHVPWYASASDHRRLSPKLKLPFLVYLGLGPDKKMLFLGQGTQSVLPDEGSLRRASDN